MAKPKLNKPRITISVEQPTADILKRMAELQDSTISGVAGPLLDGIAPHMIRVVAFMEAAKEAPKRAQNEIIKSLDRMEAEIMGLEHTEMARINEITETLKGDEVGEKGV